MSDDEADSDGLVFEKAVPQAAAGARIWTKEARRARGVAFAASRLIKRCTRYVEDFVTLCVVGLHSMPNLEVRLKNKFALWLTCPPKSHKFVISSVSNL